MRRNLDRLSLRLQSTKTQNIQPGVVVKPIPVKSDKLKKGQLTPHTTTSEYKLTSEVPSLQVSTCGLKNRSLFLFLSSSRIGSTKGEPYPRHLQTLGK